jgi:hypothetical protein
MPIRSMMLASGREEENLATVVGECALTLHTLPSICYSFHLCVSHSAISSQSVMSEGFNITRLTEEISRLERSILMDGTKAEYDKKIVEVQKEVRQEDLTLTSLTSVMRRRSHPEVTP